MSVGRAAWGRQAYESLVLETYTQPLYRIGLTLLVGAVHRLVVPSKV
jgi:hypothetical protein